MMRFVLPAIALSLGLHAGLLALTGGPDAMEHGAETAVSSTVIVFDAQPAPAVSASADADHVAEQQPVEAADQPAEILPDKEPAEAKPVEVMEEAETEQASLEPEPVVKTPVEDPQPVVEPQQVVEPEPVVETPVEQLQAVVESQQEPVTRPVPAQPVEAEPFIPIPRNKPTVPAELAQKQLAAEKPVSRKVKEKSSPKPVKKAKSRKKPAKADHRMAKQKPARKTASRGTDRKKAQSRTGSAGRSGGASAGEKAAYARRVLSHIQRYKRFPSGARAGKVGLKVRISASGTLQSASVRRSSGHRVLDKAAVATARRASPYPKPPGGGSFSFTVSLRYQR